MHWCTITLYVNILYWHLLICSFLWNGRERWWWNNTRRIHKGNSHQLDNLMANLFRPFLEAFVCVSILSVTRVLKKLFFWLDWLQDFPSKFPSWLSCLSRPVWSRRSSRRCWLWRSSMYSWRTTLPGRPPLGGSRSGRRLLGMWQFLYLKRNIYYHISYREGERRVKTCEDTGRCGPHHPHHYQLKKVNSLKKH